MTRIHMVLLSAWVCVVVFAGFANTADPLDSVQLLIRNMRNTDIQWGGDFGGLTIKKAPDDIREIAKAAEISEVKHWLVLALDDPNRWIVAHVILSEVTSKSGVKVTASSWNELNVKLLGNGRAEIDAAQMTAIKRKWVDFFFGRVLEKKP